MVSEYAGISIFDVGKINIIDYWQLRFDAFVYQCNKTSKGQEYLDNAYRISQTKPEREKLRERVNSRKEGKNG
ncbi:hypothetical protein [Thomasclavelia cocleata]|uniref:hypothetical protein n=1 Tax=Thomasclavelia cocleata TaxID=69824 RepID=UPI0025711DFE|nr:hypothetical protein [Thomasclavelia cocleata]